MRYTGLIIYNNLVWDRNLEAIEMSRNQCELDILPNQIFGWNFS